MTDNQAQAICPQCGSAAAVHSIQELAALLQGRLSGLPPGYGGQPASGPARGWEQEPQPGPPPGPQPGWVGEPQAGPPPGPQPGWVGEPQAGPPPGPVPGWARRPQAGRPPGPVPGSGGGPLGTNWPIRGSGSSGYSLEDDLAGAAFGVAARFIGKRIGRKAQQAYTEKLQPAMAARRDAMVQEQLAIAERHPGLRACLTDNVIFLAGGSRMVPLDSVKGLLTVEQADALVARLSEA